MDTHAFASLAHVRILIVPVGSIPHYSFEKYAAEIRSFESVRLGDIPADHKEEKGEKPQSASIMLDVHLLQLGSCLVLYPPDIFTSVSLPIHHLAHIFPSRSYGSLIFP